MRHSFAIVGCGKVGTALGKHLTRARYALTGISCKHFDSAEKAAKNIGTNRFSHHPCDITKEADIIFITTPDGLISEVCADIVKHNGIKKDAIVLHCSGAHPSTILSSAKKTGAHIGSMHPLQSFAAGAENTFEGVIVTTEGDEKAVAAAKKMSKGLGAKNFTINTDSKTLYHASAVVACNYLITLQDVAFQLMQEAGIDDKDVFDVLSPLIYGTLSNIKKGGTINSLTGPIARGDAETISRHLQEIAGKKPELLDLYKTLGRYTIKIAQAGDTISEETALELKKLLT